jgi:hypothetical protein
VASLDGCPAVAEFTNLPVFPAINSASAYININLLLFEWQSWGAY